MATSYPGALDNFTNPTSGDNLSTSVGGATHSAQHANLNDAVEAVQAELGVNPSGALSTVSGRLALLDHAAARVFDAVTYGAVVNGSTDDTAAWQAAIDAAAAAGGGVVTSSKVGVSVIGGALQDTSGANAQLTLPQVDYVDGESITIVLRGPVPPPAVYSVIGSTIAPDNHLVLKSTLASGTGAVIGAVGPAGTFGSFTSLHLAIHDLTIRTVANPTNTGLDLRNVADVDLDRLVVDTGSYDIDGLTQPSTSTSYGIRLPANNNGAHVRLGMVDVSGFYTGYEFAEHATGVKVAAWGCRVAAEFDATNHASVFLRFMTVHCTVGWKFTGAHAVDCWQYDVEHASSSQGWRQTTYDIDDASNYGKGFVRWWAVLAGTGAHNSFTVNSATGFQTSRVGATIGSGSSLTVQDENSNVSTTVTQIDFQGAGVTATSGTGEVVVTIPGGSGYVYRDRLTAAAGDTILTLGAAPVANSPLVWVNGTIKWPTTDYTVSSNVLTFGSALSSGDIVAVQYHSAASSASASTLTSSGVNIVDNFTRADSTSNLGTTPTGSKVWTQKTGTWGISSNKAYQSNGVASQLNFAYVDAAVADCTISAVITGSAVYAGLIFRENGSDSCYFVEVSVGGTSYTPTIYKRVAGSQTTLATGASISFASGDTLSVVLAGSSITVKRNGTNIVTATDSAFNSNTRHGMYIVAPSGTSSNARIDDFSIQP